ncbi:MAG: DUF559 domain-containing protein [Pseudomonadota bacterium]
MQGNIRVFAWRGAAGLASRVAPLRVPGHLVRSAEVIQFILNELALTAQLKWPRWFGTKLLDRSIKSPEASLKLTAAIANITAEHPEVDRRWLEHTIHALRFDGALRSYARAPASECRQWLGAIEERTLALLPQGNSAAHLDAVVAVFRWLVDAVRCNVELHIDEELIELGSLIPIAYYAVDAPLDESLPSLREVHNGDGKHDESATRSTGNNERLGFRSGTEAKLANALQQDASMAGRFLFNERVDAAYAYSYEVDILWRDGPLIVEIDGYRWHSGREQFRADRERDYRLMLAGYRVLRLTHEEVEQDVAIAVDKVRDMTAMLEAERELRR